MTILVLNAGSATLKFRVFQKNLAVLSGNVERIGMPRSFLVVRQDGKSPRRLDARSIPDHLEATRLVFLILKEYAIAPDAIGHRVVHGGEDYIHPTPVTPRVLKQLRETAKLAPLHMPIELSVIGEAMKRAPAIPHVAVFDTEFFHGIPDYITLYALPYQLSKRFGIRRFGFHGLSHEYVARAAAKQLKKPLKKCSLISCHLGSGSSVTAIADGSPRDTTMGFTPLEGLTMSTRVGDLDPFVPLFLQNAAKMTPKEIQDMLYTKSGMLGVSGFSGDMRDILEATGERTSERTFTEASRERARLARDMYVYDVQRYIGSYAAMLGSVDAIVFTGGIGERSAIIRRRILAGLPMLKTIRTLIIPTNEEQMIAGKISAMAV